MKKTFNQLRTRNILSKAQMQNVKGGGTCGYKITYPDGSISSNCNLSAMDIEIERDYVAYLREESDPGTEFKFNWCCDSCHKSSYCG